MDVTIDPGETLANLRAGRPATWLRGAIADRDALSDLITGGEVEAARDRFARFAPLLASFFPRADWRGEIRSELLAMTIGKNKWLIKGDHALPMTGSIKARGGVHELLCIVERIAAANGITVEQLSRPEAGDILARYTVIVASTGNLGYSIGVVGRAFGLCVEIHMSHDAKSWKKDRLRQLGATLVEHDCDYSETMARARAAAGRTGAFFVDDERSRDLLTGYAVAADELAEQLAANSIEVSPERRLVVYVPCGVGGAPGGITYGLKRRFGANVVCVWVEPTASPCMMVALATGGSDTPAVYEFGCTNDTIADGLAVPRASALALAAVGDAIDAAVAVPDHAMLEWLGTAWKEARLKLEPSAAAVFAAHAPFMAAVRRQTRWPSIDHATHLFWVTGGSEVPAREFEGWLRDAPTPAT